MYTYRVRITGEPGRTSCGACKAVGCVGKGACKQDVFSWRQVMCVWNCRTSCYNFFSNPYLNILNKIHFAFFIFIIYGGIQNSYTDLPFDVMQISLTAHTFELFIRTVHLTVHYNCSFELLYKRFTVSPPNPSIASMNKLEDIAELSLIHFPFSRFLQLFELCVFFFKKKSSYILACLFLPIPPPSTFRRQT